MYASLKVLYIYFCFQFNSWFPQPHADKTVTPFTVHHESEIETDVKVTNVNILNGEVKQYAEMKLENNIFIAFR